MNRNVWVVSITSLVLAQVATFATSIYLHRALAHRSLTLHPVADWLFRLVLWVTTGQSRQQWVAVHRKHHTFTDREGDPHSPRLLGFWKVQLGNVYYYVREARNAVTAFGRLPNDLLLRHGWHASVGVARTEFVSHSVVSLLRRMRILPESPVNSMFPSGSCCRPPRRQS